MKVQFLTQKFIDFAGAERSFTVAAVPEDYVSLPMTPEETADLVYTVANAVDTGECEYCSALDCVDKVNSLEQSKRVVFGVSICHPSDVKNENEELGKKIAEGKAKSSRTRIGEITMTSGMFVSYEYIEMCLKRLAELIARNPENYNISYAKAKEKFKTVQNSKKE
jgi:hypothetical protein